MSEQGVAEMSLGAVTKEGWLAKERKNGKNWNRRYFVLRGGILFYYIPKTKGSMKLSGALVESMESDQNMPFPFSVTTTDRKYPLVVAAPTQGSREEWLEKLKHCSQQPVSDERKRSSASSSMSEFDITEGIESEMEGWLNKLDPTTKAWRPRFFEITGGKIVYYEMIFKASLSLFNCSSHASKEVAPTLDLKKKNLDDGERQFKHRFFLSNVDRVFKVAAATENDMCAWVEMLDTEIEFANKHKIKIPEVSNKSIHSMLKLNKNKRVSAIGIDMRKLLASSPKQTNENKIVHSSIKPPTGQVTLAFTDVQSSTMLWEKYPDQMSVALDIHNNLMRELCLENKGYEVKTEGDAFMVAFSSALDGVRWALKAQQGLLTCQWPPELTTLDAAKEEWSDDGKLLYKGLRVRIGVHTGEPQCREDPITKRMDYFGPMVNRAARVAGAAHGGQVIVSKLGWNEIESELGSLDNPVVVDLGQHFFKGLDEPEQIMQVLPRELAARQFAPINSLRRAKSAIPECDGDDTGISAIPEEDEEEEEAGQASNAEENASKTLTEHFAAVDGLHDSGNRLVTLVEASPGMASELIMLYASQKYDAYAKGDAESSNGGVWICDMEAAKDAEGICHAVMSTFAEDKVEGETIAQTITRLGMSMAEKGRILFVIDNFNESLLGVAAGTVGMWRELAPNANIVVACPSELKVSGETVYRVPSTFQRE